MEELAGMALHQTHAASQGKAQTFEGKPGNTLDCGTHSDGAMKNVIPPAMSQIQTSFAPCAK
jgi:hypothetical protein